MQEVIFGKYIKELRIAAGLRQREIEKLCGVSNSYLSQLENGQRGIPSPDILKKLAPALGVSYEDLLVAAGYLTSPTLENNPSNAIAFNESTMVTFPVFGRIGAGKPKPIIASEETDEYVPMDTRFLNIDGYNKDDVFFLRIKGHSMEPTIADSDLVLIRRQPTVDNNEIAAVRCNREDAAVKRVLILEDKIILSSDNKAYSPIVRKTSECQIIGKVLKKIGDVK